MSLHRDGKVEYLEKSCRENMQTPLKGPRLEHIYSPSPDLLLWSLYGDYIIPLSADTNSYFHYCVTAWGSQAINQDGSLESRWKSSLHMFYPELTV